MRRLVPIDRLSFLEPGEVLSTFANGVEHFGLLTDEHFYGVSPTIVSASKTLGFVAEEFPLEFSPSGQIFAHGHWGRQSRQRTARLALSKLGQSYDLFENNCEQFVRECQGLPIESPQLANALGFLITAGALYGLARLAA